MQIFSFVRRIEATYFNQKVMIGINDDIYCTNIILATYLAIPASLLTM